MSELLAAIEAGQTVPSSWYTDPAVFKREQAAILRGGWHYVTDTGSLPDPGGQVRWEIGGVPIVLVRGLDGLIRGFVNICRHRAHPVVLEDQCRTSLQCHYHGWTYDLDGSLRNAPRSKEEPEFDPAPLGLEPIQVHVWGPMVWANVSLDAPVFDDYADGLKALLRSRGCRVEEHELAFGHDWIVDCNWKVLLDNTIECYHCPTSHPELSRALVMDPDKQELAIGGRYWIYHRIPFRDGVPDGITWQRDASGELTYFFNYIFPAAYVQYTGKGFDVGSVQAIAVDKVRWRHLAFLPKDTPPEVRAAGQRALEQTPTINQDVAICNRVQAAHESGFAPPGHLLPQSEHLLTHFYKLIVELVTGDSAGNEPDPNLNDVEQAAVAHGQ
jgi:phenylpropionate dioxygenase-like ring-hydroxylating dioxygenase large terminal subunit